MEQPTYEELQKKLQETELKLLEAKAKNKSTKEPELLVEYETGFLQIRRLMGRSINLPTFVVRWILENAQQILKFISANQALLAAKGDEPQTESAKQSLREKNLSSSNPVVRKPRAANQTV